jgi:hypothetical protein
VIGVSMGFPNVAAVDEKTNRVTPDALIARSTVSAPVTLVS